MKAKTTNRGKSTRQPQSTPPRFSRTPAAKPINPPTDAAEEGAEPGGASRRGGPRGSAPWTTRHAAKHAAEAAARNATPPAPGSARATLRTPAGAEELKALLTDLASATARLRAMKRTINKDFWEAGLLLVDIRERRLFEARGYASFDAFAERELDFGRATAQRLSRIPRIFLETAARELGLAAIMTALEALEADRESQTRIAVSAPAAKPLKPPAATRN